MRVEDGGGGGGPDLESYPLARPQSPGWEMRSPSGCPGGKGRWCREQSASLCPVITSLAMTQISGDAGPLALVSSSRRAWEAGAGHQASTLLLSSADTMQQVWCCVEAVAGAGGWGRASKPLFSDPSAVTTCCLLCAPKNPQSVEGG